MHTVTRYTVCALHFQCELLSVWNIAVLTVATGAKLTIEPNEYRIAEYDVMEYYKYVLKLYLLFWTDISERCYDGWCWSLSLNFRSTAVSSAWQNRRWLYRRPVWFFSVRTIRIIISPRVLSSSLSFVLVCIRECRLIWQALFNSFNGLSEVKLCVLKVSSFGCDGACTYPITQTIASLSFHLPSPVATRSGASAHCSLSCWRSSVRHKASSVFHQGNITQTV